ncbi:MAG: glycosyltransferase [Candidatus Rokuibacteriota bacterium]
MSGVHRAPTQLLVTTGIGGGPKQVYDLVRSLPRGEFEVIVAAPRDGIFFERFQELGVRVEELPLRRLGPRHLLSTIRLIRALGIDVVHTHGKGPGLYGRLAVWWTGVPAVHTFHGIHYRSRGVRSCNHAFLARVVAKQDLTPDVFARGGWQAGRSRVRVVI